jgi:hypothetical protein
MSRKIYAKAAHGIKAGENMQPLFSRNHFASATPIPQAVQHYIDQFSMHRVAGNVYECPSTKDFWKVQGNKIVKLVGNEVNAGESIAAAPDDKPAAFLAHILDDLEF